MSRVPLALRVVLALIPVVLALWWIDGKISRERTIGWERNTVINSRKRWRAKPTARVAILGSSTSKDWLPEGWLARGLGVAPADVLDAHMNGCHQDCTWAQVRRFVAEGRRFDAVLFGTNLFQLCEFPHTKRALQQSMLVPASDIPRLLALYLHAEDPLLHTGRLLGVTASGGYGDTAAIRARLDELPHEDESVRERRTRRRNAWRWARRRPIRRPTQPITCAYGDDDIAYKLALTEALLDDLTRIADRVYLMMLPERTLADDDPEMKSRWARHLALHRRLADARPRVSLVDLVTGGVSERKKFRDAIHLGPGGMREQRALFARRMRELGAWSGGP